MDTELQIVFKNLDTSQSLEKLIREKADKLELYFQHIIDARVIIEKPHKSQRQGNSFHATIEVNIPGRKLVVSREPGDFSRHDHAVAVVNDAFSAMYKQLESHSQKIRGDVKQHDIPPQGKVLRKFPEQDYGFIRMSDGREVYFHRNSVINPGFDELEVDQPVRVVYAQDESPIGPQATTVEAITDMQYVEARPI